MTDPISVAGSVVGVISLGIQVTQWLVKFYTAYKNLNSDLVHMTKRLESLLDIFQYLEKTLSDRSFQAGDKSLIENIETSITNCDEMIQELQDEWKKFSEIPSKDVKAVASVVGRRGMYPFRRSTLQKLDEEIDEIRANLSLALEVLQLKGTQRIEDDENQRKVLLDLIRTDQISSNLLDWLKAPDASKEHNTACEKKHPGTGIWLTKSSQFSTWLTEKNSLMWLNGFAGSGKSVLCSTAILSALRHRGSNTKIGIAFFYFAFNDESKQDVSAMLRALLLQLSSQLRDGHTDLTRLYESQKPNTPRQPILVDYLHRLIQRFHQVFIFLDALDESPRNGPRPYVLDVLQTIRKWNFQGLHLFFTSRDEPDIRDSLDVPTTQQVALQSTEIDQDIVNFISGQFEVDQRLRKWAPYRDKIQLSLAKRANGMFRWVECQIKSLQTCPCSEHHLEHLLDSLPQSLDETYERMLCNIDDFLYEDARRILTLLCFASRPLTVQELIDAIAVEINDSPRLNYKRRLQDYNSIREICGGFIESSSTMDHTNEINHKEKLTQSFRIAHFSVQEYLVSERIRNQKAAKFSLTSVTAHGEIAKICLIYLLEPGLSSSTLNESKLKALDESVLKAYPLAKFAALRWYHHYRRTVMHDLELDDLELDDLELEDLILRLFQSQDSYVTWLVLYEKNRPSSFSFDFRRNWEAIPTPMYYASFMGLYQVLDHLLNSGQVEDATIPALQRIPSFKLSRDVNAQQGQLDEALQAASCEGHKKVVQILLNKGADINARGGADGSALYAASERGHEKVVQMLLSKGADINAQGGIYGNALQVASYRGHEKVVIMLLNKGADIVAQDGDCRGALYWASCGSNERIVQMLLDKGADITAQGGKYDDALIAASYKGHEKIMQMLLDKGADVKALGIALQEASLGGHEKVVQMLLDKGADVKALGIALQEASLGGYEKVVQMLLDKGADVNAPSGPYGNALHAALSEGHEKIVQILLDKGADVNAPSRPYSNALQEASFRGHEKVVQMLLDKGADINAPGRPYGNALQQASRGGYVYAPGGDYGKVLSAALNEHLGKLFQRYRNYGSRFPIVGPRSTIGLDQLI